MEWADSRVSLLACNKWVLWAYKCNKNCRKTDSITFKNEIVNLWKISSFLFNLQFKCNVNNSSTASWH